MRHPEAGVRMPLWREESSKAGRPQPTRNGGRQGERLSESSASRLTAHAELGGLSADLLLAWAHGSRRRAQAGCVSLCVACLSTPRVVGVYPHVEPAAGRFLLATSALGGSRWYQLPVW